MPPLTALILSAQPRRLVGVNVLEFFREWPDDETCLRHIWRERFAPDGEHAHCERCETERVFKRYETAQKRPCWFCSTCGFRVHPLKGTIFEGSSTSLQMWFYAMYIMTSTRCGVSAKQLERELGVTYKTAWRMFNKIRNQLMTDDGVPLSGSVEMDETFIGGKPKETERRRLKALGVPPQTAAWDRHAVVFGAVERERAASRRRLSPIVAASVIRALAARVRAARSRSSTPTSTPSTSGSAGRATRITESATPRASTLTATSTRRPSTGSSAC